MKIKMKAKIKDTKCHTIIHAASAAAAAVGAGLAQVPGGDSVVLTQIQSAMTVALGRHFGIDTMESLGVATVSNMAATAFGRAASQIFVGWLPGIGNAVNASTAAAVTETMGWLLVEDFSKRAEAEKE